MENNTQLKNIIHKSFHSCADVFIGQSPRNDVARSKDKRISNSVNYFQIALPKGYTTLHPRDVQKCLFLSQLCSPAWCQTTEFLLVLWMRNSFSMRFEFTLLWVRLSYVYGLFVFSFRFPYVTEGIFQSKALFLYLWVTPHRQPTYLWDRRSMLLIYALGIQWEWIDIRVKGAKGPKSLHTSHNLSLVTGLAEAEWSTWRRLCWPQWGVAGAVNLCAVLFGNLA